MRSQLRLRVILPVAVLGLLGAGFGAFAKGGAPEISEPALGQTAAVSTTTAQAPAQPQKGKKAKKAGKEKTKPKKSTAPAGTPLERELRDHRVVVVLFYAPGASYDTIQTREARAGAHAAGVGFLAVDVSEEDEAAALATEYDVRKAPTTLVFVRGPRVAHRIGGYADRSTVEQAAVNARR